MSDAYDRAMSAEPPSATVFGQLLVDVWDCILIKGEGKVLFDPSKHPKDQLRTAISLSITPLADSGFRQDVERSMIAESAEWTKFVLPSVKALGTSLREMHERFVQAELVPTGRKYTNAAGESKDATTIKFLRVFPSEDACAAAALGSRRSAPAEPTADTSAPAGTGPDPRRAAALKFVPMLWRQAKYELDAFEQLLARNALTRSLRPDDADVLELLTIDPAAVAAGA